MSHLYHTLQTGRVGIFESPTGTGKSLSIICASLHWLSHNRYANKEEMEMRMSFPRPVSKMHSLTGVAKVVQSSLGEAVTRERNSSTQEKTAVTHNWFETQLATEKKREASIMAKQMNDVITNEASPQKAPFHQRSAKTRLKRKDPAIGDDSESESETEGPLMHNKRFKTLQKAKKLLKAYKAYKQQRKRRVYANAQPLASVIGDPSLLTSTSDPEQISPTLARRKLFFCSRTHSQLNQFVEELRRSTFVKVAHNEKGLPAEGVTSDAFSCTVLGSRKHLCSNQAVFSLGSDRKITERCKELLEKGSAKEGPGAACSGCACKQKKGEAIDQLAKVALNNTMNIEDLGKIGRTSQVCAYYASRQAVLSADIICLPYNMILDQTARDHLGLDLHNSVVIFDEAHNLIEAVRSTYNKTVNSCSLSIVQTAVKGYLEEKQGRLGHKTASMLRIFGTLAERFLCCSDRFLKEARSSNDGSLAKIEIKDVTTFTVENNLEDVNLFRLVSFLRKYKYPQRISSYARANENLENSANRTLAVSVSESLWDFLSFLEALQTYENAGRVILKQTKKERQGQDGVGCHVTGLTVNFEFVLLDVSGHFNDILQQSHAVIFAGGTMQPYVELRQSILGSLPSSSIHIFSCDHVVPDENVQCIVTPKGPTGKVFHLDFRQRAQTAMLDEIGMSLVNISAVVPKGVVAFFPCYKFLETCRAYWSSPESRILERLSKRKAVFWEEATRKQQKKQGASDQLSAFAAAIGAADSKGAILLSVMSGKLSEGINFAGDMCRCVILVGMPFPNMRDPLTKLKADFSSMEHYSEVLCMKTVNQCVGRAIRSKADYAAIVLLDTRYQKESTQNRLSSWVSKRLSVSPSFGATYRQLQTFFKEKRAKHGA